MRIKIEINKMNKMLEQISVSIDSLTPYQILKNMKMTIYKSTIKMEGYDGTIARKIKMEVDKSSIIEEGEILMNFYLFYDLIKRHNGEVEIFIENKTLKIKSLDFETEMQIETENESYPNIFIEKIGDKLEVDNKEFIKLLNNVQLSVVPENNSKEKTIFKGVNIVLLNGELSMSSTNKSKLSFAFQNIENKEININVTSFPKKLKNAFINPNGKSLLYFDEQKIHIFEENSETLISLIDGIFPDVSKARSISGVEEIEINKNEFLPAIKSTLLKNEKYSSLDIEFKKQKIKFETIAKGIGKLTREINSNYDGDKRVVTVNGNYLSDIISSMDKNFKLGFGSEHDPVIVESIDKKIKHIIMPIRRSE
ncbi:MAG: DNA polymerase III subunit beta [Mollicutes bacterium PWAP]|nr:DNA polymerase III subunit beta [Mollicutes bacterium PWAP]